MIEGKYELVWSRYSSNNNKALQLYKNKELYYVATVNTDKKLPDNQIAIKNYSENEGMVEWLLKNKIIKGDCIINISSGYVEIPVYEVVE